MGIRIDTADYRALARLRYLIRGFLFAGDAAARRVGLEPQQYQLMLAIRGLPENVDPTVHALAEQLALRHNSTVELIDRMEKRRLVCRDRSSDDRRYVLVSFLPKGERLLEKVARQRLTELRSDGVTLAHAIDRLLGPKRNPRSKSQKSQRQMKSQREQR